MDKQKAYVSPEGKVTVLCPECASSHVVDVSKIKGNRSSIKVKCPCGPVKHVDLEFRRAIRKSTHLPGMYTKHGQDGESGPISVENVSKGGIGFIVSGNHTLSPGDKVTLEFKLDDPNRSRLERTVEVCSVDKKYIGGKFHRPAGAADPELGFYLMP